MFDRTPLIIGHRGAAGLAPENTLPSFELAVDLGVDAIELDVHRCEDSLVVIHDETVDRTTNGRGSVAGMTLTTLRDLDAGNGAPVPLLEEVLELLPARIGINIELKGKHTSECSLPCCRSARNDQSWCRASTTNSSARSRRSDPTARLRHFSAAGNATRWRSPPVLGEGSSTLAEKSSQGIGLRPPSEAGLKVLVYTVNDLEEARSLIEIGVWGIFTDFPDRISRAAL